MLNSTKAKKLLKCSSLYSDSEALFETIEWYRQYHESKTDMSEFTLKQIQKYVEKITLD